MSRIRNRAKIVPAEQPAKVKAPAKKAAAPAPVAEPVPAPRTPRHRRPLTTEKLAELTEQRDVMLRRVYELTAVELFDLASISGVLEQHVVAVDASIRDADLERVRHEAEAAAAADVRPPAAPDDPGPQL